MLRRLLRLLLFVAVGVLLLEGALRLVTPPPFNGFAVLTRSPKAKLYGWAWPPHFEMTLESPDTREPYEVVTNSEGWKDVEHERDKPEGRLRILVLGDTTSFGSVPLEQLYTRRLEAILHERGFPQVEVITLAVGGWGTDQQLEVLTLEGIWYQPDLVILQFSGNDLVNNASPNGFIAEDRLEWSKIFRYRPAGTVLEREDLVPREVRTSRERFDNVLSHTAIGTALAAIQRRYGPPGVAPAPPPLPGEAPTLDPGDPYFLYGTDDGSPDLRESWVLLEELLLETASRSIAGGASFTVFSEEGDEGKRQHNLANGRLRSNGKGGFFVGRDSIAVPVNWTRPLEKLREICKRKEIGLIEPKRTYTRFVSDPAPTPEGNEAMALDIADSIEPWLRERAAQAAAPAQ